MPDQAPTATYRLTRGADPTAEEYRTAFRNSPICVIPERGEPVVREHHRPPVLPEPPLLCRLGLHHLSPISIVGRRRAGAVELASVTSTCRRAHCALSRHEQHRVPPGTRTAVLASAALAGLHALRTRLAGR